MTNRASFLLLIAVLLIVTLASAQHVASTSANAGRSAAPLTNRGDFFRRAWTKVSFRNAPSNDKSSLWRDHLALSLVRHPEFNEKQKKVIWAAISLATPEFFEVKSSDPGWQAKVREPLRSLEAQITSAFSLKEAATIFATLGNTESAPCIATYEYSVLLNMTYKPLREFGGQDKGNSQDKDKGKGTDQDKDKGKGKDQEQDKTRGGGGGRGAACECSTDSDWCPIWGSCSGTSCSPTQSGCGTLWSYPCNGAGCR